MLYTKKRNILYAGVYRVGCLPGSCVFGEIPEIVSGLCFHIYFHLVLTQIISIQSTPAVRQAAGLGDGTNINAVKEFPGGVLTVDVFSLTYIGFDQAYYAALVSPDEVQIGGEKRKAWSGNVEDVREFKRAR